MELRSKWRENERKTYDAWAYKKKSHICENSLKKSKRISCEWQRKKIDEIYWMRDEGSVKGW